MKKVIIVLLIILSIGVTGCGKNTDGLDNKYTKTDEKIKEEINKIDINMEDISVDRLRTEYGINLEVRLSNYDNNGNVIETEELKRVKNRVEEEINGYYVYIVSSNNEEILKAIKDKIG